MTRILLVRHGRSAHRERSRVDRDGVAKWLEAYDRAGLDPNDAPPAQLRELARHAFVVTSDVTRARESAALLSDNAIASPLLRETQLPLPSFGRLRLPMRVWSIAIGVLWIWRMRRGDPTLRAELERAREAAKWLIALAAEHETVLAITHGAVRRYVANALLGQGWTCLDPRRKKWAEWSAWELSAGSSLRGADRSR
jgi:broad specificity phosphatase PhoE